MTLEEKKMEFVVFCIENVAEQLNELPENIYSRLNNLGLIDDLLFDCYEVLHTQSKQHITEDIILALKNRERKSKFFLSLLGPVRYIFHPDR